MTHPAFMAAALLVCTGLGGVIGFILRGWYDENRRHRGERAGTAGSHVASPGKPRTRSIDPVRFDRVTRAPGISEAAGEAVGEAAGPTPAIDAEAGAPTSWAEAGNGLLVLLVDDRREILALHSAYLHEHGYDILTAMDGEAALALARTHHPAVIILDHSMPRRTGIEVARELKGDPDTRHIPIVLMTAHSYGAIGMAAREAGCESFLAKPVEPSRMLREVATLTGSFGRRGD